MRAARWMAAIGSLGLAACENDARLVGIPLSNEPPVAVASATTSDFSPLDTAVFDGTASHDPDGVIASWQWSVIERPEGSASSIAPIDGGRYAEFFVDLAGDYVIRLRVTDDRGASDETTVSISAVPWQALHVQLSWDTNDTDIDLHLVDEDAMGSFCGLPYDCFYGNKNPNWGSFSSSADDPHLDIDDINGLGPENINLDAPETTGRYRVLVHYYRDGGHGSSTARIRIYLAGALAWEGTHVLSSTNKTWNVATVDWATQTVTVHGNLYDSPCSSF